MSWSDVQAAISAHGVDSAEAAAAMRGYADPQTVCPAHANRTALWQPSVRPGVWAVTG